MSELKYVIKKGDTLWAISKKHLGDPFQWPRLWKFNNRKEVISVTGRGIPNPDLIYPGQVLLIPKISGGSSQQPPVKRSHSISSPPSGSGSLQKQLRNIADITALSFNLGDVKLPPIIGPGYIAEVKMTGKIVISGSTGTPMLFGTNKPGASTVAQRKVQTAFQTLISENSIDIDLAKKRVTLSSKLIMKSNYTGAPSTSIGGVWGSESPVPKIRAEFSYPKLKGHINGFSFVTFGLKYVVDVTPTPIPKNHIRVEPEPVPTGVPVAKVVGGVLVVAAGALIVGTIVEDFLTLGVGVADDPASFAAAAGLATTGRALWTGRSVLPKIPTWVKASLTVTIPPIGLSGPAHAGIPSKDKEKKENIK